MDQAATCARPGCDQQADTHTRGYCESDYRRRIRMGMHGLVDPAPVLAHLAGLRELGWTWEQIGHQAGVSPHTPYDLHRGTYKRLRTESARALLAVPLIPRGSHRGTASTGTRRRVQALSWMGWPCSEVARRAGTTQRSLATLILPHRRISHDLALRVHTVFGELCMRPGPSKVAAAKARSLGFAPPLAWGEDIDDPGAEPDLGEKPRRRDAVAEDAAELAALYPADVVAERLGVSRGYITQLLRKAA